MKALILNNKVVDLVEKEFEVHSSLTWVDCDDTVEIGMDYDGSNFSKPTVTLEMHMSAIRSKRNFLLKETDWYGNSDVTMSADMTTYRQNLRDITNGIDTVEKANNITWPTKP
jgi:hypothetical protein